jgi:hypothetical protein
MSEQSLLVQYKNEIADQLKDKQTLNALVETTFKGLKQEIVPRAMLEGYMRGFKFDDFLKKNVYAVPFGGGYSLVTSIDYARKIGQKNGVVGKTKPDFTFSQDGKVESCTITIKKHTHSYDGTPYIGEFTATVFMDEYSTGKQLWASKPRTMIAKVAEMHALRMACPEDAQQMYVEEEYERENVVAEYVENEIDTTEAQKKLIACKTVAELQEAWMTLSAEEKLELAKLKDEIKEKLTPKEAQKSEPVDDIIEGQVEEPKEEPKEETPAAKAMREAKEEVTGK